jgi:hypothetical protein
MTTASVISVYPKWAEFTLDPTATARKNRKRLNQLEKEIKKKWKDEKSTLPFDDYCKAQLTLIRDLWQSRFSFSGNQNFHPADQANLFNRRIFYFEEKARLSHLINDTDALFKSEVFPFDITKDGPTFLNRVQPKSVEHERICQSAIILMKRFLATNEKMAHPKDRTRALPWYQSNIHISAFIQSLKMHEDDGVFNEHFYSRLLEVFPATPANLSQEPQIAVMEDIPEQGSPEEATPPCKRTYQADRYNNIFFKFLEAGFLNCLNFNHSVSPTELLQLRLDSLHEQLKAPPTRRLAEDLCKIKQDLRELDLPLDALKKVPPLLDLIPPRGPYTLRLRDEVRETVKFRLVCKELQSSRQVPNQEQLDSFISHFDPLALSPEERVSFLEILKKQRQETSLMTTLTAIELTHFSCPIPSGYLCTDILQEGRISYFESIIIVACQQTRNQPEKRKKLISNFCLTCLDAIFESNREGSSSKRPFLLRKKLGADSHQFELLYFDAEKRLNTYILEKAGRWLSNCDRQELRDGFENIMELVQAVMEVKNPEDLRIVKEPSADLVREYVNLVSQGRFSDKAYRLANEKLKVAYLIQLGLRLFP